MMLNRPWLLKWLNKKVKNFYANGVSDHDQREPPDGGKAGDRSP
jgi:hypothetical protein